MRRILEDALEVPSSERAAFVGDRCAGDESLARAVHALIAAHDEARTFLEAPQFELATVLEDPSAAPDVPKRIGRYRILRKMAEGGMGEVFLAEQDEPVRRHVALKRIKWGMNTREVIARFEAERQALALMDHPAIARVFDAGATQDGAPYFVMEFVDGVPIHRYCDENGLSLDDRLELFLEVCVGVQHAHRNAIIHRDLKPSNVLVTTRDDRPEPKIIDFGIAKAISTRLTEKTLYTGKGVLVGTPEYMSPEQAAMTGSPVDTRTDVYSLGVMLYELMVGVLPFDPEGWRSSGFDELLRQIRETEPSKPSTRLSTLGDRSGELAGRRGTAPSSLKRRLVGDLDWITMKALEKDPARRYGSPQELADDIKRYLDDRPVAAGPPSIAYQLRKFVRRHTVGVLFSVTALAALISFAILMTIQTQRITAERDRANQESEGREEVTSFLVNLFRLSKPEQSRGNTITVREALDAGLARIDDLENDEIRAGLLATMGDVYGGLGLYDTAVGLSERAVQEFRRTLGDEHPDTLEATDGLASFYGFLGRYDEAEPLLAATLEARRRVLGDEAPETLTSMNNLAMLYKSTNRSADAEELYVEALRLKRRVLGREHGSTLDTASNLAELYRLAGRDEEALTLMLDTLEIQRRVLGADHPTTLISVNNLALYYRGMDQNAEAEPLFREALAGFRTVNGETHPYTLITMKNLAEMLVVTGRFEEAEPLLVDALDSASSDVPPMFIGVTEDTLGACYVGLERYDEAEPLLLSAFETLARLDPEGTAARRAIGHLVEFYEATGDASSAEDWRVRLPVDEASE